MRITTILFLILCVTVSAWADDVQVFTVQSPLQDNWTLDGWVEELSTNPHNQLAELISSADEGITEFNPCPTDYDDELELPNVLVSITNMTQRSFRDLYYVGDVNADGTYQTTFTNVDELVGDSTTTVPGLAFKIDKVGLNQPLVSESKTQDQIFEPGETWTFVIQQYSNTKGLSAALLGSVGADPYGAIAQASAGGTNSSGSIITPEPATMTLLAVGLAAILRRRGR